MKNWEKLRENFRKALNRRKRAAKSGAGGNISSTCRFFKELSFLTDVIGVKTGQSNVAPALFTPPASPAFTHESPESPVMVRRKSCATATSQSSTEPSVGAATSQSSAEPSVGETPLSTMRPISTVSREQNKKRKNDSGSSVQSVLERAIQADLDKSKETVIDDPDELFCKSLAPSLKGLSKKKNKQAKIKMMQVLLDMESDSD